jgi:predicted RNase H-like HicB family nuclease
MFRMDSTGPKRFTAMIYREDSGFVSICPELDVASQGHTIEEVSANLREAVELFIETAGDAEVSRRLESEMYVTAGK